MCPFVETGGELIAIVPGIQFKVAIVVKGGRTSRLSDAKITPCKLPYPPS